MCPHEKRNSIVEIEKKDSYFYLGHCFIYTKINMSELRAPPTVYRIQDFISKQHMCERNKEELYENILEKCMFQMKLAFEKKYSSLLFTIPSYIFGYPRVDYSACSVYLLMKLHELGFQARKVSDHEIFIDWSDIYKDAPYLSKPVSANATNIESVVIPSFVPKRSFPSYTPTSYAPAIQSYVPSIPVPPAPSPPIETPMQEKKDPLFIIRRDVSKQSSPPIPIQQQQNPILSIQEKPKPKSSSSLVDTPSSKQSKIILKTKKHKKEINRQLPSFL
jgi:Family of unknown function (DUF5759)